jgi:hypothetical protein
MHTHLHRYGWVAAKYVWRVSASEGGGGSIDVHHFHIITMDHTGMLKIRLFWDPHPFQEKKEKVVVEAARIREAWRN